MEKKITANHMVTNLQHNVPSKTTHVLPYLGNFIMAEVRKLTLTLTLTLEAYYGSS